MRRLNMSLVAVVVGFATIAVAQPPLKYRLSSPSPAAHLLEIELTVPAEYGCPDLSMAAWTPGGYGLEFHAGKVVTARFSGPDGQSLEARKPDLNTWRVVCRDSGYTARMLLYVSAPTNPYSADAEGDLLFANLVAVLPYLPAYREASAELSIEPPKGWDWVSSLPKSERPGVLTAADWDELADGMVAAAPSLVTTSASLDDASLVVAFTRPPAGDVDLKAVTGAHTELVRAAGRTFGSVPFKHYLFLYKIGPKGTHGGLEHADGTAMGLPGSATTSTRAMMDTMGLAAHELVHAWNVKRARPRQLRPYDYGRIQRTDLLWVAEGWTSYYGPLLLERAGIESPADLYKTLTRRIQSHRRNPANRFLSLEQLSQGSWLDRTAPYLSFRTYYNKGSLTGLDLDLRIRTASGGRHNLDDLMQILLEDPELRRTGYSLSDLRSHAAQLAGRSLDGWFDAVALEPGYLDLEATLRSVGLRFVPDPSSPAAWTGLALGDPGHEQRGASVRWAEPESPAALAGVGGGDLLLAVDGRTGSREELAHMLDTAAPLEALHLTLVRNERLIEVVMTPAEPDPQRMLVRVEEDPNASQAAVAARNAWLWRDRH